MSDNGTPSDLGLPRYPGDPSNTNTTAWVDPPTGDANPSRIDLFFAPPGPQRRLTILFRLILVIPQIVVIAIVGIAAALVVIFSWFAALALGRLPRWAGSFLVGVIRWQAQLFSYIMLLTDRYPPFSIAVDESYPVQLAANPGPLNRAAVFFRLIIGFPGNFYASLLLYGMILFSPITWVITLVLGRLPEPLFKAHASVIRFAVRSNGYQCMVTSEWPWGSYGDLGGAQTPIARPEMPDSTAAHFNLVLQGSAKRLVTVFLVIGILWTLFGRTNIFHLHRSDNSALQQSALVAKP